MKYVYTTESTANTYFNTAYDTPEEAVRAARLTALNWNNSLLAIATGKILPVPAKGDTAHVVAVVDVPRIKMGTAEDGYPVCAYHRYMTPDALAAAKKEKHPMDGAEIVCLA